MRGAPPRGDLACDALALSLSCHAVGLALASAAVSGLVPADEASIAAVVTVALVAPFPWLAGLAALLARDLDTAASLAAIVASTLFAVLAPASSLPVALALWALLLAHGPSRRLAPAAFVVDGCRVVAFACAPGWLAGAVGAAASALVALASVGLLRAGARRPERGPTQASPAFR